MAILHARRCGWLSGQQLGMHLLEGARRAGAELVTGRLAAVDVAGGRVTGVRIDAAGGPRAIATERLVLAAGPLLPEAAGLLGLTLPVFAERHHKIAIEDTLGAVPRDAPFLIWDDAQTLDWSAEEREALEGDPALRFMLEPFPAGVHTRPEGASPDSRTLLVLWSYDVAPTPVVYPFPDPPHYPELVLRGMARMVPAFRGYLDRLPRAFVDGGYYGKTAREPPADRPPARRGRLRHERVLGLRDHGRLRGRRAPRRPRHGLGPARLRAGLPPRALRRSRVRPADRGLGRDDGADLTAQASASARAVKLSTTRVGG